jgi:Alpha/beta hydrolase domain
MPPRLPISSLRKGLAVVTATGLIGAAAVFGTVGSSASPVPANERLSVSQLRKFLNAQDLPTTEELPVTKESHPFNGAAWQNEPINLAKYGYVEHEYLLSGKSNVYDSSPNGNLELTVLRSGDVTTRMLVRQPKKMEKWSGKVNVEIINPTSNYDFTAVWSALWERTLSDHDIYVGITSKPAVLPGMQQFDPERYADLSWANPLPPEEQTCADLPGDENYDPNFSKLYENGLVWDLLTQTGRLLKSDSAENPLGARAKQVILTGESQSARYLLTYYRFFTPSAVLPNGKPIFDGYFSEVLPDLYGWELNQCDDLLGIDDSQRVFPDRKVPWAGINSQAEYSGHAGWDTPADSNTSTAKRAFWELAGSNHGWEWQYLYGDASAEDVAATGVPATDFQAWSCGRNNPEVPVYMSEKALFEQLQRWIETGEPPSQAPRILHSALDPNDEFADRTIYDRLGNAKGGIRYPMVAAPVASFGEGEFVLTGDCRTEIVPFDDATLDALYPKRKNYLDQYDAATDALLSQKFILQEDVAKLRAIARKVTSVG